MLSVPAPALFIFIINRYSLDIARKDESDQELMTLPRPRSMVSEPGTTASSPSFPSSPVLKPTSHKAKWTSVLKDLPHAASALNLGGHSSMSTPGPTPSPTLEVEDFFETKKLLEDERKEKRRKRKKAEVFVSLFF